MSNCNINLENLHHTEIARRLRKTANQFDPVSPVRRAAVWFLIGAITVSSMDYADVWLCVGQCDNAPKAPATDQIREWP